MVIAARYCGSYTLWYRSEVRCRECGSVSALKLVEGEFVCAQGCRPGSEAPVVEQLKWET